MRALRNTSIIRSYWAIFNSILVFFQMFERETRREKILEARNKELRLKEKTKGILGLGGGIMGSGPSMYF